MSAVKILQESPKLTDENRSAEHPLFHELDRRDEAHFLHESAEAMFLDLDQQEAQSARCASC